MRILLVYAHPVETSFNAAIRDAILGALQPRHSVDLLDLNAEGFDPVMTREERLGYHAIPSNLTPVQPYVDRLLAADALILCFPAWSFGPPAILKGWLDRVMLPGVSFTIRPNGRVRGGLGHLRKLAGVVTYGQTHWRARMMGDYPRKLVCRYLRYSIGMHKPAVFHAHYAMNVSTDRSRARFLREVQRAMADF